MTPADLAGVLGARYAYVAYAVVASLGVYLVVADANLVKKVVGLNLFQTAVFLFFVSGAVRTGGSTPVTSNPGPYVNPLPHVLVLTAIVVGVSLTALALALVVRVHATYGTIEEDRLRERLASDRRDGGERA
jgi:multicomponent Na+:H+ antiporter subunit C